MENIAIRYQALIKPFWAPEVRVFGVVWSFLYVIIFLTLIYLIFFQKNKKLLALYISNIIMNLLYGYFQGPDVSAYVLLFLIVGVLFTIIYFSVLIRKINKYVFAAQIPYVIRVFIATNLWISVMFLNNLF